MHIIKTVSFNNNSQEYPYYDKYPLTIQTKKKDGPNLYTSFFEQLVLSSILNKNIIRNLIKKYHLVIQSNKQFILQDIKNILHILNSNQKYNFYLMNFCLHKNSQTIHKLQDLYRIIK